MELINKVIYREKLKNEIKEVINEINNNLNNISSTKKGQTPLFILRTTVRVYFP